MTDHEPTLPATAGDAVAARPGPRRTGADPLMQVRSSDVQPYTGLGYLSKLFRLIAVFLVLLLVLEVGSGLYTQGTEALPTLMSEASRLVVLAGLLWGTGDLANLLIDIGHDVRATRILLGRQVAQATGERPTPRVDNGGETPVAVLTDARFGRHSEPAPVPEGG